MNPRPRLVLLGKQGAGKGTQAVRLAEHYQIAHLSTGDMFRAQAALGTAFGLESKRYMDSGDLVPDEIVIGVIEECLAPGGPLSEGFVLDGFPRNRSQTEELERVLDGRPIDIVIHLEVPREIVVDRLSQRRVCVKNSGHIYSVGQPPKTPWICDHCDGDVIQREDDTPEAINKRLDIYERDTRPIREFYESSGRLLVTIDGLGDTDEVFNRCRVAIDAVL
jgi:adenylate kinase